MNRRNRQRRSLVAIRTGVARSGSRSTSSRFNRCGLSIVVSATISPSSCRLALAGAQTSAWWRTRLSGGYCGSSCPTHRGADQATARTRSSSPSRHGETTPYSTSISTARPARGLAHHTRRVGPRFAQRSLRIAAPELEADKVSRSPPGRHASPRTGTRSAARSDRSSSRASLRSQHPGTRRRHCEPGA